MTRQYIGARYVPLFDGDYDATKVYEPLTIVQYNFGSYTSKKTVPAGILPTNSEYWALTGNYNAQVEAYRQEVVEVAENVETLFNYAAENKIKTSDPDETFFYINGYSGSDDYDGKTALTPFKTLDHALSVASKYYTDVRLYISYAGTYECDATQFSGVNIHLIALVSGVTILFKNNASFYGPHLNLQGATNGVMTITVDSPDKLFYLDGGSISAHYVDFNCVLQLNGAYAGAADCIFRNVYCHGGNLILDSNTTFKDKVDSSKPAIRSYNGIIQTRTGFNFDLSQDNDGMFMQIYGGILDITSVPTTSGQHVYNGDSSFNHCVALFTVNTKTFIDDMCSDVTYGPVSVTNLKTRTRVIDTSTAIESDNYTDIGTFTIPAGDNNFDVGVTISNAASDVNGVLRLTPSVNTLPTEYISINGLTGRNVIQHLNVKSYYTNDVEYTVAGQYLNGHTARLVVDNWHNF